MSKMSIDEMLKIRPTDLYPDCSRLMLQLASILNYLQIDEFNNKLIDSLRTKQTFPFSSSYTFRPFFAEATEEKDYSRIIHSSVPIKSFRDNILEIEQLVLKNFIGYDHAEEIYVLEKGLKAWMEFHHDSGYDSFLIEIINDHQLKIKPLCFLIYLKSAIDLKKRTAKR
jgi:hypothetical protein